MDTPTDALDQIKTAISFLELYHTQYEQSDKLWNYFGVITLAVLGFTIGNEKATKSIKEAGLIICGYWVFCFGNFHALQKSQNQLVEFADLAKKASMDAGITLIH